MLSIHNDILIESRPKCKKEVTLYKSFKDLLFFEAVLPVGFYLIKLKGSVVVIVTYCCFKLFQWLS